MPSGATDNAQSRAALLQLGAVLGRSDYAFVTVSPSSHRRVNRRPGNELAADLRGVFGWNRPFDEHLLAPEMIALMGEANILQRQAGTCKSALRAATLDGRLYFHSAFPTREADAVFLGPDTYRFVTVLQAALDGGAQVRRAVDIGCGAGPGALTIAALMPHAEVWATDINPRALELSTVNAQLAGLGNVRVAHSDLLRGLEGRFDLIASNPPFMSGAGQRLYSDGGGALGEGLSIDIVNCAIARLAPGGTLVLYTCVAIIDGADPFRERAGALLDAAGCTWHYREIDPDLFGAELGREGHRHTDRIAAVALVATATTTEFP